MWIELNRAELSTIVIAHFKKTLPDRVVIQDETVDNTTIYGPVYQIELSEPKQVKSD